MRLPAPVIGLRWFDLPVIFPLGEGGSAGKRRRLEANAKEKITHDVREQGYEPIPDTLTVRWMTSYEGRVSVAAVPLIEKGAPRVEKQSH